MSEELQTHWSGLVAPLTFAEYSEKYRDFFVMTRHEGVLELRMCTDGGPYVHTWAGHDAWSQVWNDVGADPDNEVLILTGTGDRWFTVPAMTEQDQSWDRIPFRDWSTDGIMRQYKVVVRLLESLIFNVSIPTIAAINGPGPHTEFALACDLTLCTPDVDLFDPHFIYGVAPGDGMYLVMQELMGLKQGTYHAYTGASIDGPAALRLGLVNEVLPREQLLPRAWELAEMMMRRPRGCRAMTSQIVKRRWKRLLVQDLEHHVAHQHYDMVAERETGRVDLLKAHGDRVPQSAGTSGDTW